MTEARRRKQGNDPPDPSADAASTATPASRPRTPAEEPTVSGLDKVREAEGLATPRRPPNGHGRPASPRLFDASVFRDAKEATDFIGSVLEASTEYSIIGKSLDGRILLWNEGARRIYGYDPEEVVGKANSEILHPPEDVASGLPRQIMEIALREGKWEGTIRRIRKNGTRFTARVVTTPRLDSHGEAVGFLLISKDVTEETRLTEQLEATQSYTRSLIESNIDALMTTDPVGIISDVNQQMEELTGFGRDELIGTPFKRYFTDPERADAGIRLALREGRVTNYELTARSKDGRETIVSYNATTFLDREGKLQGVFAAARDITEQKELERQLRESQDYNRGLIEASVDGLITVDPRGVITDVNEQMCRLSGYPREDLVGTPFANYFVDPERATEGVGETLRKGVVTDYVLRLSPRDAEPITVSFNASVFTDAGGTPAGIFASARDITEQARLQAQLSEERAYNRGLIEASLDGLVTVDPMLVITDVNETMCRMAGYGRDELVGSPFNEYFTDSARAAEGVRLTLDTGAVTNYELTLRGRDGRETLVSFNAAIFRDDQQHVRGIFASARDITAQSTLQRQLANEQAYNRGLIEASVDGLLTVDANMIITDVNETMCRMVGRPRSQLINSVFTGYFSEPELAADGVRKTFEAGLVTNYVLTLQTADGRSLPVSFNAAVYKGAEGNVQGIFASARDITEQQELERQLRSTEAYTRSLIESNIDALMTTDPLGIITDVNEQMESLTGVSRQELAGTPFKDYFTEPERAEQGIRLALREGRVTNYELTARNTDGTETVVSYNATTFLDQDGKLQGVFAAARAVAEQKTLESQLREQQTYLRGLIESSVDGLITVDPDGFISDVNEQLCRMTGYSRTEILGTPFADYFTDSDRAREGVRKTFESEVVTEYALTLVSRNRRQLEVSFNASVFRDALGAVKGIFASARDISERTRLEEQLREQQTYLRGLIESSVDGLVTVDPQGFITDVNEQLCRMSGYNRDELIGSPFKGYFTNPDYADAGVRRTLAEGVVTNYELIMSNKSGAKATVSFNASVYRGADQRIQGIFASARDISAQARLQKQLGEQEAYNRSLIEASADALFAIAADGVITDVNEEATRLTGYSRKHLVNSRFAEYFVDPDLARAGVEQTIAQSRVIGYELVLVTRQGRRITVSFNAGVFTDVAGNVMGILAGAREITSQKELEQQLRDSQVYTRSLIESNIDALMTTDQLGVISDVNQQMEELTGRSRDELTGTAFKQYFTDPDRAEDGIRQVLREGRVTNYELTARHKSGRETVVSYNAATFLDRDGKLLGVFAAARDVTERKSFEEELQQKNVELEQANLAKDRFLASMSHELRTPLNAIIGFTGTLLMGLPGPLNEEQTKQLRTVQGSGKHLLAIINDLLDLAKVESGTAELQMSTIDCRELLENVLGGLAPLATAKGLALDQRLPDGPATVHTDSRLLSQIIINLVNNAIKFTDSGRIEVALGQTRSNGSTITSVAVTDTGMGISADDRRRLFEAFAQLEAAQDRKTEGSGLGLYISQRLAALLHGNIEVESEVGKGSTFRLVLAEAVAR